MKIIKPMSWHSRFKQMSAMHARFIKPNHLKLFTHKQKIWAGGLTIGWWTLPIRCKKLECFSWCFIVSHVRRS